MNRLRDELWVQLIAHVVMIGATCPIVYLAAHLLGHPVSWLIALLIATVLVVGGVLIIHNTDLTD